MFGRETISSLRRAADYVSATGAELTALTNETRADLPALTDAVTLISARVSETLPSREEAEETISEIKQAAQHVSMACVIISAVALAMFVTVAVTRAKRG